MAALALAQAALRAAAAAAAATTSSSTTTTTLASSLRRLSHELLQLQQHHPLCVRRRLHLAPPFLVDDDVPPAAVTTYRLGRMPAKVAAAREELRRCVACPRACGVDRLADDRSGVCRVGRRALVSTVAPHFAEEQAIKGWRGSGTVFFASCNLRCVFCQNADISWKPAGFELTADQLADWMLRLQDEGQVHNINFVTPEHVAPQVAEAIAAAVARGLSLPIVYNTSGYDALSSLALMEGLVDVYLPDMKFWSPEVAARLCKARDYPEAARAAIKEMHRQVGDLAFTADGIAKRGLLLRHLVMPGEAGQREGRAILRWVAAELGRDTFVHLMPQYRPAHLVGTGERRSRTGWDTYDDIGADAAAAAGGGGGEAGAAALEAFAREELGLWRFEALAAWESGELAG